jgi:hypothetical protein
MMLKMFWFKFEADSKLWPTALNLGCGVTAYNYEDAVNILKERVFAGKPFPKVSELLLDVNVQDLDPGHVVPNMGVVTQRGVWFPLGF